MALDVSVDFIVIFWPLPKLHDIYVAYAMDIMLRLEIDYINTRSDLRKTERVAYTRFVVLISACHLTTFFPKTQIKNKIRTKSKTRTRTLKR